MNDQTIFLNVFREPPFVMKRKKSAVHLSLSSPRWWGSPQDTMSTPPPIFRNRIDKTQSSWFSDSKTWWTWETCHLLSFVRNLPANWTPRSYSAAARTAALSRTRIFLVIIQGIGITVINTSPLLCIPHSGTAMPFWSRLVIYICGHAEPIFQWFTKAAWIYRCSFSKS